MVVDPDAMANGRFPDSEVACRVFEPWRSCLFYRAPGAPGDQGESGVKAQGAIAVLKEQ